MLDKFIRQASQELGIPYEVCHKAYMSAWKFIYEKVQEPELSADMPVEEFRTYRPNFNIRGIGKLYVTEREFTSKSKKYLALQKLKKEKNDKDNEDD